MPDFERSLRSLEQHLAERTSPEKADYVRGRHDGLSQARRQVAYLVAALTGALVFVLGRWPV